MSILSHSFLDVLNSIVTKAKIFKSTMSRNSISRMGKESIIETPLLISGGIDPADVSVISKSIERQEAAFIMAYLSTHNSVDLQRYGDIAGYLQQFTNDSSLTKNIKYTTKLWEDTSNFLKHVHESVGVDGLKAISITAKSDDVENPISEKDLIECWYIVEECLNDKTLNDEYLPFKKVEETFKDIKITLESDELDKQKQKAIYGGGIYTDTNDHFVSPRNPFVKDPNGSGRSVRGELATNFSKDGAPKILNISKDLNLLEPTLIQCEFLVHDSSKKNASPILQTIIFGVKTMIRSIPINVMVSNIVQGINSSKPLFKFIKWTKGELSFSKDLIFNISQSKEDAMKNKTTEKVFANLRSAARKSKIGKAFGLNIPVTVGIIITDLEAIEIEKITGINLREDSNALEFLNKQFLFYFGIFSKESKILSIMFDGYDTFSEASISALKQTNSRDTSLNDLKEVLKVLGRY